MVADNRRQGGRSVDPQALHDKIEIGELLARAHSPTRLVGARSVVEVGTFTGYSSLAIAYGLPIATLTARK